MHKLFGKLHSSFFPSCNNKEMAEQVTTVWFTKLNLKRVKDGRPDRNDEQHVWLELQARKPFGEPMKAHIGHNGLKGNGGAF